MANFSKMMMQFGQLKSKPFPPFPPPPMYRSLLNKGKSPCQLQSPPISLPSFFPLHLSSFKRSVTARPKVFLPPSSIPRWIHDVFISYKLANTCNFVSHLHNAFERNKIRAFVNLSLERGVDIAPAINEAIEQSRSAIVAISQTFPSLPWCLDELVKTLECKEKKGQLVFLIFVGVDPRVMCEQSGLFMLIDQSEKGFRQKNADRVQTWRDAIRKAGNLTGWPLGNKLEAEFIQFVGEKISRRLSCLRTNLLAFHPIGLDSQLSTLQDWLQLAKNIIGNLSGDLRIGIGDFDTVGKYEQALKVLDTRGSDVIELEVPYSDCLADGPVFQAAAARSLPWGCAFDAITSMLKVVLQLSSPVTFLKLGFEKFMSILKDGRFRGQRPPRVNDIFISYKQHDTLHFVSHLKSALDRRGIKTFVDSTLEGGVEVQPAIEEAIEQSKIAVVIVSQNYHLSPWCLIELEKILECQRKWGLIVLPILRGMDVKDLREQPRHFVENIGQGEKGFKQEQPHQFQKYRDALRALGRIKALPVLCSSIIPEATVIEDAADQISARVSDSV